MMSLFVEPEKLDDVVSWSNVTASNFVSPFRSGFMKMRVQSYFPSLLVADMRKEVPRVKGCKRVIKGSRMRCAAEVM